ncbi:MAG: glucosidase [Acidobacteriota bacterium]|nr:glucosidase [Acidobacteriota bacterium]
MKAEEKRLEEARTEEKDWKLWGCYLSERAWGTVREDYSATGAAWDYFPFEQALSKAFRWNEDGIAGICDRKQRICFAVSFWNEKDKFLKERFYGLGGNEGNHGEDVKEYYFYLDNTPTHSYQKFLYKYPHDEFPYEKLREENAKRDKSDAEYELLDTGVFDEDKYFDVFIEYAKADFDDIRVKITAVNRGRETAPLHILPTIFFRNRWSWSETAQKPRMERVETKAENLFSIHLTEEKRGDYFLTGAGAKRLLFTENETNFEKLYDGKNESKFAKDGINDFVVNKKENAVNPLQFGTKAAAHYVFDIAPQASETIYLRLSSKEFHHRDTENTENLSQGKFIKKCEKIFVERKKEADEFYKEIIPNNLPSDAQTVMRQSLAGMLWSKQFYHYVVKTWLEGDEKFPPPPKERLKGRNSNWKHLYNDDVILMPDKWEYPWFAAWDTAFHCVSLAIVDSDFAKWQLVLPLREWYLHPNGQIPAYEWAFGDVNPPVHAWAALRVYQIEARRRGVADREFLEKIFHKLLLNFTWWVNRKDFEGNNVFEGGFLGLDNIGVFDRNSKLPNGGHLEQSDGTSWMAMYCLNMLAIALELAKENKAYEDVASKFFEHFVYISDAMNNVGKENTELWNERDGFYYDVLHLENTRNIPLKVRSMVGLIPLFAVETIEAELLESLPEFKRRAEWFLKNRSDLTDQIACMQTPGEKNRLLLALVNPDRLRRILRVMLSETEFLSDYGVRALSRFHKKNPYVLELDGVKHAVEYEPGESRSGMFGGNSNWRGPIWFPVNYLLIESLQKFDFYLGEDFRVEFPTGSEKMLTLWEVSQELSKRLSNIFLKDADGRRAVYGNSEKFQADADWRDYVLFYEYFHGDDGCGLGASHQTGWTGLIGKLLQQTGEYKDESSGGNTETGKLGSARRNGQAEIHGRKRRARRSG